jgi:divalent metal cation (Fe/Co/Zn/Cd) transporter
VADTDGLSDQQRLSRRALVLVAATAAYNSIEAVIALWSGILAGSVALVGFGLDSVIELAAAAALIWRLSVEAKGANREHVERVEERVHRFVGVTFLFLAIYVVGQSGWTLWTKDAPEESVLGMGLAIASLTIMPLIAWAKLKTADKLGSKALRAEAKETLACSYLSFALFIGLACNAAFGWWWADPAAALLMVPWLIKEGLEGVRGEDDD